jgi:aldehyde dehydrogenase (NAD+)
LEPLKSYIDGAWVRPMTSTDTCEAINPATEQPCAVVAMGGADDVDRAVRAARRAFATWGFTSLEERVERVREIVRQFEARYDEMVRAISTEMGAPYTLSHNSQAACGPGHLNAAIEAALEMEWEKTISNGGARLVLEPIGVAALITPWNWPVNQLAAKLGPALLAGCTVVLKPSEVSPLSAQLLAEFVEAAGLPPGVFNMVHGAGPVVGHALSTHPEVDVVSFTGSTRAGIQVAKDAADTVKRVSQELGGKSPNIVFADAGLETAVDAGVRRCFGNSGQSCNAPTRMLVEASVYDEAVAIAAQVASSITVGDPTQPGPHLGPVVNRTQFEKIQRLIQIGIDEGARLVAGGPGKPDGFATGYYVKPTVFADVTNQMTIAREEIFGPVLAMIPFKDMDDAISIANDTPYGLAAYVQTRDMDKAHHVARRLRAGMVSVNGASQAYDAPFGGYKQSGNGREWGGFGLHDYLEYKSINGY